MHQVLFYQYKSGCPQVADYIRELASQKSKDSRIKLKKIQDCINALKYYGTLAGEPYMT
ncbi:MAG: hypothetical protein IJQ63_03170 [Synergistaceae bacterium]|nr:hypothetical protein [Synergistaceae bacterium]